MPSDVSKQVDEAIERIRGYTLAVDFERALRAELTRLIQERDDLAARVEVELGARVAAYRNQDVAGLTKERDEERRLRLESIRAAMDLKTERDEAFAWADRLADNSSYHAHRSDDGSKLPCAAKCPINAMLAEFRAWREQHGS